MKTKSELPRSRGFCTICWSLLLLGVISSLYLACFHAEFQLFFDHFRYWRFAEGFPRLALSEHRHLRYPVILVYKLWREISELLPIHYQVLYSLLPLIFLSVAQVLVTFGLGLSVPDEAGRRYIAPFSALLVAVHVDTNSRFSGSGDLLMSGFVCLSAIFLVKCFAGSRRRYVYLSALFFILSYATKVNSLFFLPGVVVVFLLFKRPRELWLFLSCFVVYVLLESLFLFWRFGLVFGRFQAILASYGKLGILERFSVNSPFGLLRRYDGLPGFGCELIFLGLVCACGCLWLHSRGRTVSACSVVCSLFFLSFLTAVTFSVKNVAPFVPLLLYDWRYLLPLYPFMAVLIFSWPYSICRRGSCRKATFLLVLSFSVLVLALSFNPRDKSTISANLREFASLVFNSENSRHPWIALNREMEYVAHSFYDDQIFVTKDNWVLYKVLHFIDLSGQYANKRFANCESDDGVPTTLVLSVYRLKEAKLRNEDLCGMAKVSENAERKAVISVDRVYGRSKAQHKTAYWDLSTRSRLVF